jgi:ribosome-associated toxin RatA of RatAB toxin-antitoxin module
MILLFHSQLPASEMPEDERLDRLRNGEILLLETRTDESGGSARVQAIIHAPAKAAWDVITSCEQTFTFVKGLKKCEIIEDAGDRALIHQVVKTSWLVPTQDFVFESLRDPYHGIRFQLVEGNLKAMKGLWQFTDSTDGLLLDYEIRIQPGFPVPAFIVSWVIRKGMPDLVACIRGLAGGSGSAERVEGDLDRCRGAR